MYKKTAYKSYKVEGHKIRCSVLHATRKAVVDTVHNWYKDSSLCNYIVKGNNHLQRWCDLPIIYLFFFTSLIFFIYHSTKRREITKERRETKRKKIYGFAPTYSLYIRARKISDVKWYDMILTNMELAFSLYMHNELVRVKKKEKQEKKKDRNSYLYTKYNLSYSLFAW